MEGDNCGQGMDRTGRKVSVWRGRVKASCGVIERSIMAAGTMEEEKHYEINMEAYL